MSDCMFYFPNFYTFLVIIKVIAQDIAIGEKVLLNNSIRLSKLYSQNKLII